MAPSTTGPPGVVSAVTRLGSNVARALVGGSLVSHITWVVLGGIAGVGWVANSSYADPTVKRLGMWLVFALALVGLATVVWTSVSPLANVLGKDVPGALKIVREKPGTSSRPAPRRQTAPAPPTAPRREKVRDE